MEKNAPKVIAHVLKHEGGYVHHPRDPGGCTNRGITLATLRAWRRARTTCADVRNMTEEEAVAIYRARYWDAVDANELPSGVDAHVVDMAVNAGPQMAAKLLQRVVGVDDDGDIGPITLGAVHKLYGTAPHDLIHAYAEARMAYYRSLRHWPTFGRGWTNRTEATTAAALALVVQSGSGDGDKEDEADAVTLPELVMRVTRIEEAIGLASAVDAAV